MMALLLVCSLPVSAFADTYDLAQGSVTVTADGNEQTVTHGSNAGVPDSAPVITGTTTTNTITITATENATANVTLELDVINTVQSGCFRADVEKDDANGSGNLTITDETGTPGSLNAIGSRESAGIGGGYDGDAFAFQSSLSGNASNITITGSAEVTATGEGGGAGIGGENGTGSDITVSGDARVKVQGSNEITFLSITVSS